MALIRIPSITELDLLTPPATPSSTLVNGKLPGLHELTSSVTPPTTPPMTMARMNLAIRVRPSLLLDQATAHTHPLSPAEKQIPPIRSLMNSVPAPNYRHIGGPFTAPPSPSGSLFSAVSWNEPASRSHSVPGPWMSSHYSPPLSRRGSSDGGSIIMTPTSGRSTPEFPVRSGRRNNSRSEPYPTNRGKGTEVAGYTDAQASEVKRSNLKYTTEQQDFLIFHREDLMEAWKDVEIAYLNQFPASDPLGNRKVSGIQCIFYRQNLLVPLMNNTDEKLLVLDAPPFLITHPAGPDPKNSDLILNEDYAEYVVYKGVPHRVEEGKVRKYGRPRLLLERSPEVVVEQRYDWLPREYIDKAGEIASKRHMQRWQWLQQYGSYPGAWIDRSEPAAARARVAEGFAQDLLRLAQPKNHFRKAALRDAQTTDLLAALLHDIDAARLAGRKVAVVASFCAKTVLFIDARGV
ncbi:hypothetical protein B0T21DRAFT_410526 [Apiosordaria backusii]|uniref:Uncharacterized protein n=1 Tax=Apiosordaria backusii TaxID=314023 RepID=A0AA40EEM2_9PEZI|nr:hypothetical protein B0T21DRAFT_410526 [Apiosordaria backusii]